MNPAAMALAASVRERAAWAPSMLAPCSCGHFTELKPRRFAVTAGDFDQLLVSAFLDQPALLEQKYHIPPPQEAEPIRYNESRPASHGLPQGSHDFMFGFWVHRSRGIIQEQNGR